MADTKKIFLVTGGNSGIGFECCRALAKLPGSHVILAGRSHARVSEAVAKVKAAAAPTSVVEAGLVDLGSLASVRDFADKLRARDLRFSTLVCNAGVQVARKELTIDGFESTFGINHLGHFLLVELLRDCTQRILVVSSGTHDPAERTGMPEPNVSDLDQLARGMDKFNNMEAYTTSKLLNLLFTKEFVRRYPNGPKILAYTPGYTPDSGLSRNHNKAFLFFAQPVFLLISWWVGSPITTSEYTGGYMAKIAGQDPSIPAYANGDYIRVDEAWQPSSLAMDPVLSKELWDKSVRWAGLQ
ncbi:hypothetical protein PybrP1_002576 [[Pythium] brassicae (nom. inval.)]|nr:hypothetical protein PybrP1_002576 [[Pythium] brassicae (nom. inval.)]